MTLSGRDISELLAAHGLHPSRALGQNFVVDPNTVRRIARLAGVGPGDRVVEIGAGLGSLTLALVETGAEVTAIEVDRGLVPVLRAASSSRSGVRVIEADALKADWPGVLGERPVGAGRQPSLQRRHAARSPTCSTACRRSSGMLVMVQREVGERLAAAPGTTAYGAVSVKVAYWARAEIVGRVPPTVFLPKPKVESALVRIVRREAPAVGSDVDPDWLFTLVRAGFGHRRKMLRRSLPGVATAEQIDGGGHRTDARAPRSSTSTRGVDSAAGGCTAVDDGASAPAKLTRELRITGRRARRLPPASTPRWCRSTCTTRSTSTEGDGLEVVGPAPPACRPTTRTSSVERCALVGRTAARARRQAHPRRWRARRRVGRRGRDPPVGRGGRRRARRRRSAPTSRSAWSAGGRAVTRHR